MEAPGPQDFIPVPYVTITERRKAETHVKQNKRISLTLSQVSRTSVGLIVVNILLASGAAVYSQFVSCTLLVVVLLTLLLKEHSP